MSFFAIVPPQMHIQLDFPCKPPFTDVALERFLSGVDPYVDFYIPFRVEAIATNLADKRSYPAMDHLDVLAKAETVNETLSAMLADVDPAITMYPVMTFKSLGVWEVLPTEFTGERPVYFMETDMALQCIAIAKNTATLPTLVPQQMPSNDSQRL